MTELLIACAVLVGIKILFSAILKEAEILDLSENSKLKFRSALKNKKTGFGNGPDLSGSVSDTIIETPVGKFAIHHDGIFRDVTNKLMWIQAPWGMEWNGKRFKGECIPISWKTATRLFGFAGTIHHGAGLKKEHIETYGYNKYKRGCCTVEFSGYSDWRLPTAYEL